jgi:hypothetical protein
VRRVSCLVVAFAFVVFAFFIVVSRRYHDLVLVVSCLGSVALMLSELDVWSWCWSGVLIVSFVLYCDIATHDHPESSMKFKTFVFVFVPTLPRTRLQKKRYNSTVFAYGQTGSGKTFTITGGAERYVDRGIIPRALSMLFSEAHKRTDTTFQFSISYLEIYKNKGFVSNPHPKSLT